MSKIVELHDEKGLYLKLDAETYEDLKQIVERNGQTIKYYVGNLIKNNVQAIKFSRGE